MTTRNPFPTYPIANPLLGVILAIFVFGVSGCDELTERMPASISTHLHAETPHGKHGDTKEHRPGDHKHASADAAHDSVDRHNETEDHAAHAGEHHAIHKLVVTSPTIKDVTVTQQYVCQIHSRRHIEICALEGGYLKEIKVNEGQMVRQGEPMFHILPTLYEARLDADLAEAQLARVEYENTQSLVDQNIVSNRELKLAEAKLAKANAKVKLAQAEKNFADIRAPFDGIVDRLHEQEGSLIEEGAMLTTLSDNSVMWVYFNVPEARYLDYQSQLLTTQNQSGLDIELRLANHRIFPQKGKIGAIEAEFNNETGNIAFRADFPNPDGLLRHGQTGTILIHQTETNAMVIPQRSTFEILAKRYVYVVDAKDTVHQREIDVLHEQDDIYVIQGGVKTDERIVLEGVLQVRDGQQVAYEYRNPDEVLANLKYHAE
ncbi:efflux RND transporter periplasmic adaptor subunit [Rhodopirellula sp. JC740]|uniref:Efflux RND transporter periplasmic adaptor subunit n=1 Tax=Rhodopirellula halodulae TaxID=2894198 RepID=A0ABS8NK89_9BACT|nr:efflux RND transporter periplasmic adaptor subunit [Rhodopirellula sp. JC740]MCC9643228.1 efflux RND transporter periplasmic adaptor subunit [Rhodopirellula sp. JC740]